MGATPRAVRQRTAMPSAGVAEDAVIKPVMPSAEIWKAMPSAGDTVAEAEIGTPVTPAKNWMRSLKRTSHSVRTADPHTRFLHVRDMKALRA